MPDLGELVSHSDLEFIRDKIKDGDWFEVTGPIDALTNKITFIPASGKTAYLYAAKIVITGHATPAARDGIVGDTITKDAIEADLIIDAVVKDTTNIGTATRSRVASNFASAEKVAGNNYGNIGDGRFDALGKSLVGDGVKEIAIENVLDDGSAKATMSGWIEDT